MARHTASIKLPVLLLDVSGEYSRFKKPTGLENLILTAIGTRGLSEDTWEKFLSRLSIPETMVPLFENIIKDLDENGVIRNDYFDFSFKNAIMCTSFTDTGRDLFVKGRIKQDPKTFSTSVYYHPSARLSENRFQFTLQTSTMEGFEPDRFSSICADEDSLMQFIIKKKNVIGAGAEDEILSIDQSLNPEMFCIKSDIVLTFDEVSGDFSFDTNLDSNFIKKYYTIQDILPQKKELFVTKGMELEVSDSIPADWESYRFHLPIDFSFKGKLKIFDQNTPAIGGAYAIPNLGYSFVDLISSSSGRGYIFVDKDVHILGMDGSIGCHLLVSRSLTEEEIITIVKKLVSSVDTKDLNALIELLASSEGILDNSNKLSLIRRHLESSDDVVSSIVDLKRSRAISASELSALLESIIVESDKDLVKAVDTFRATGLNPICESLARKYDAKNPDENLAVADQLLTVSSSPRTVSVILGVNERLPEFIIDGRQGSFVSKQLLAANAASASFEKLKGYFHIESPSQYDLTVFNESELQSMKDAYTTFSKSMDVVKTVLDSNDLSDLSRYVDLLQNLNEIYGKDAPLESLNGYLFGIGIRRRMEGNLRSILKNSDNLATLIKIALDEQIVTKEEQQVLLEIKDYGNLCAHPKNDSAIPPVNSTTKKNWIRIVNELPKRSKKPMKKK